MNERCKHINPGQTFHTCGSYAFNLRGEGIEQGTMCDVHYWQAKAEAAEKDAAREREAMLDVIVGCPGLTVDQDKWLSRVIRARSGKGVDHG